MSNLTLSDGHPVSKTQVLSHYVRPTFAHEYVEPKMIILDSNLYMEEDFRLFEEIIGGL